MTKLSNLALTSTAQTLGLAHTLPLDGGQANLARVRDYIGQYVCIHSAPSAWFGMVVDASIDGGVVSVDLADGSLWTQGQVKDLIRPGRKSQGTDLESRRDGIVTVQAVTALQPAGSFHEGQDKLQDGPQPRKTRVKTPRELGISLASYAKFQGVEEWQAAHAIMEVYEKAGTKKNEDRGNFAGLLKLVEPYCKDLEFPVRGIACILLHESRKYWW